MLQSWGNRFSQWNNLFQDHEIHVRTGGHVRFLTITAAWQRQVATVALLVVAAWLLVTAALLGWQAWTSWKTRDVDARSFAVARAEAQVAAERQTVEGIAASLDARQDSIEALFQTHFGGEPAASPTATATATAADAAAKPVPLPASAPAAPAAGQVGRLEHIAARQEVLIQSMTEAVGERTRRAEAALRSVGLRPTAALAQGGPFLPWHSQTAAPDTRHDPALRQLVAALSRMERLEALLISLPSDLPTPGMALTSGFGPRHDPFNGQRAMHAGLDFRGAHGTPIRTAAAGRVAFVGTKGGYGNVVEIDHGHGLMTRYAHLSRFAVRAGDTVRPGDRIALMGSTGRSTGPHLHFEVHVNGAAVNPRPFLEATRDVLETKADAGLRLGRRNASGGATV